MRILFFTSLKGFHGVKWLKAVAKTDEVYVATFSCEPSDKIPNVKILQIKPESTSNTHITKEQEKGRQIKSKKLLGAKNEDWLTFKIGYRYRQNFALLIDQIRPNLIHAHQSLPFGWYAYLATKHSKNKPPLIVSAWGTDVMSFPDTSWLYRYMNKRVLNYATSVTATGQLLKKRVGQFLEKSKSTAIVIPFGIDLNLFKPKARAPEQVQTFGTAKQLKKIYRLDLAIKALAIASKKYPAITLEVAGAGPELNALKQLAKQLEIENSVNFLGLLSPEKMAKRMRSWDVLLNPTAQEGFGVIALEAAASGTPMIATNTGGLPEVIVKGQTAILLENLTADSLAKSIMGLIADPTLLDSAFNKGPTFVKDNYNWEDNLARMLTLYEETAR